MESIKIYAYSRCSTCRKALKWLDENNLKYDVIDIINNPPSKDILKKALLQFNNKKLLFNTHGGSYRKLGASAIASMSKPEAIDALAKDSKLIKRPFIISNRNKIVIGFKLKEWEEELLN